MSPEPRSHERSIEETQSPTRIIGAVERQPSVILAPRLWKEPKIGTLSKGVQVNDDDEEMLRNKYKWKKEVKTKMIQTDDIILETLAQE